MKELLIQTLSTIGCEYFVDEDGDVVITNENDGDMCKLCFDSEGKFKWATVP